MQRGCGPWTVFIEFDLDIDLIGKSLGPSCSCPTEPNVSPSSDNISLPSSPRKPIYFGFPPISNPSFPLPWFSVLTEAQKPVAWYLHLISSPATASSGVDVTS
jgi:hypothetical protein